MKTFTNLLSALFITFMLVGMLPEAYAQTGINYQAVARDGSGKIMKNETISVRFTINDANSNQVYQEVHSGVTTSDYGVFALVVGSQNASNFNSVDWSSQDHELMVEVDPDDGTNWTTMGTKALQSVPYSYHADMGLGELNNVNTSNLSNGQLIKWDGSEWSPSSPIWNTTDTNAFYNDGYVGIGTSNPSTPLQVKADMSSGPGVMTNFTPNNIGSSNDVIEISANLLAPNDFQFVEFQRGSFTEFSVNGNGDVFTNGNIEVNDKTSSPDPDKLYGNSMPIAYGSITGNGNISGQYGIASVTRTSVGEYEITLQNDWVNEPAVMVTTFNASPTNDELVSYSVNAPNKINVSIANENGNANSSSFSVVVFGEAQ